jgi:hypothetical protein
MILFMGFAFEFFIRGDNFFGALMIFNGLFNLLAHQQAPRRIATITVLLNLFNTILSLTVAYNYSNLNYVFLFILWILIGMVYLGAVIWQVWNIQKVKRSRKRHKKRIS